MSGAEQCCWEQCCHTGAGQQADRDVPQLRALLTGGMCGAHLLGDGAVGGASSAAHGTHRHHAARSSGGCRRLAQSRGVADAGHRVQLHGCPSGTGRLASAHHGAGSGLRSAGWRSSEQRWDRRQWGGGGGFGGSAIPLTRRSLDQTRKCMRICLRRLRCGRASTHHS